MHRTTATVAPFDGGNLSSVNRSTEPQQPASSFFLMRHQVTSSSPPTNSAVSPTPILVRNQGPTNSGVSPVSPDHAEVVVRFNKKVNKERKKEAAPESTKTKASAKKTVKKAVSGAKSCKGFKPGQDVFAIDYDDSDELRVWKTGQRHRESYEGEIRRATVCCYSLEPSVPHHLR